MSERPTPETDEQINGKPCTRFAIYAGDSLRDAMVPSEFARRLERERDEARASLAELRSLPASAGDASPSRVARGYLHEAGVVGALRERLDRVTGLLRDVERETRQPSERFDEVWTEVREVLRG